MKKKNSAHFYIQDHLGNCRVVEKQDGTVEQVNHYYPYGGIISDISTNHNTQPYKYNGKELDRMHGLDWYDYGARNYDGVLGRWNRVDRLCEMYYHISPYAYCAGNPVNRVDINGDSIKVREFDVDHWNLYTYSMEKNAFLDSNGNEYSGTNKFYRKVAKALTTLSSKSNGKNLVTALASNEENVLIQQSNGKNQEGPVDKTAENISSYINWNPNKRAAFGGKGFISLGHELAHSYDRISGTIDMNPWEDETYQEGWPIIARAEIFAVHYENLIRMEHSKRLRKHYLKPSGYNVIKNGNESIYIDASGNHLPDYSIINNNNFIYKYISVH